MDLSSNTRLGWGGGLPLGLVCLMGVAALPPVHPENTRDTAAASVVTMYHQVLRVSATGEAGLEQAQHELRAFIDTHPGPRVVGAAYGRMLELYAEALSACVNKAPADAPGLDEPTQELRARAEMILNEAIAVLADTAEIGEVRGGADRFLGWMLRHDARSAASLAATFYDAVIANVPPHGLSAYSVAMSCRGLGVVEMGRDLCLRVAEDPQCNRRGATLAAAALCASEVAPPNWELACRLLKEAAVCEDMPDNRISNFTTAENLERLRTEWRSNAVVADPASRVAGFVTLWQRGLYEPMIGYMSQRLWDEVVREGKGLPALRRGAPGPVGMSDIEEEPQYPDGRVRVRAALVFEEGTHALNGSWRFDLIQEQFRGELRKRIWVIDRIWPPEKGREQRE